MTPETPTDVQRSLRRLDALDPIRPMVELVFEADDPAVTAAVVCKLLAEIRTERESPVPPSGSSPPRAPAGSGGGNRRTGDDHDPR